MSVSNQSIEEFFVEASDALLAGRPVSLTPTEHPEYAEQIAPLLAVVEGLKALPKPLTELDALAQIEQRALTLAKTKRLEPSNLYSVAEITPRGTAVAAGPFVRARGNINGIFRTNTKAALLILAAAIVVIGVVTVGLVARYGVAPQHVTQQLESYTGVISSIEPDKWVLADNAEMLIDNLTEIHGQPVVGARMLCLAERLSGSDRYRALEIWILSGPDKPKSSIEPVHDAHEAGKNTPRPIS